MHRKYLESKQQYLALKDKIISLRGGNYSCSNKPTTIFRKFCNNDRRGKYKTIEDCIFSEECFNVQKQLQLHVDGTNTQYTKYSEKAKNASVGSTQDAVIEPTQDAMVEPIQGADVEPTRCVECPESIQYYTDIQTTVIKDIETGNFDADKPFNINAIKCVLWHFFDGFVDSGVGATADAHIGTLRSLGLYDDKIRIIEDYPSGSNNYNPFNEIVRIFTDKYMLYDSVVKSDDNAIILVTTSRHQMAVLIINDNGKKYISLVNSGDGIQHHYTQNDMYNLWQTYELTPNKTHEIISRLALLMTFAYNENSFRQLVNAVNATKPFSSLYGYGQIQMSPPMLNAIKHIILNSLNVHTDTLKLYYDTFAMLGLQLKPVDTIFNGASLAEFTKLWGEFSQLFPRQHPLHQRKFVITDGYMLTDAQKSGSCTWFSLFWSIIAIKLIFDGPRGTIDYVKKLDDRFAEILVRIIYGDYCYTVTANALDSEFYSKRINGDLYLLSDLARKIGFNKQGNGEVKRKISISRMISKLILQKKITVPIAHPYMNNTLEFTRICANLAVKLRKGLVNSINDIAEERTALINIEKSMSLHSGQGEYVTYFDTIFLILDLMYYVYVIKKGVYTIIPAYTKKHVIINQLSCSIIQLTKEELYTSYDILHHLISDNSADKSHRISNLLKQNNAYIFGFEKINIIYSNDPYDCYSNKIYYDLNDALFGDLNRPNMFYQLLRHNKERSQSYIFKAVHAHKSLFASDIINPITNLLIPGITRMGCNPILDGMLTCTTDKNYTDTVLKITSANNIKKPSDLDDISSKVGIVQTGNFRVTNYISYTMNMNASGEIIYKGSVFTPVRYTEDDTFSAIFGAPNIDHNYYNHIYKFVENRDKEYLIVIDNPECDEGYAKYAEEYGDCIFLQKRLYIIHYDVSGDKWTINGRDAILNPDIKLFPFMIFAPKNITKFVYRSGNSWNMMCFARATHDSIHIFPNNNKFSLIDLKISHNMITPIFTTRSMTLLQNMYKSYGGYAPALGLLDDSNTKSFSVAGGDDEIIATSSAIIDLITQGIPKITLDKWNYIASENLDHVKPESLKKLLSVLKTHISFNRDEMGKLVRLYGGAERDIAQFLNRNPILTASDITDDITVGDINKCIGDISDTIFALTPSMNYKRGNSVYHLIYDNADTILHIMQSNFMINHLIIIRDIIDKGKNISENKFEIFRSLSYVDCPKVVDVQSLLFMVTFGNFYTSEQVDRYVSMKKSMNEPTGHAKFPVHHFMMGKGKSSVITPLIAINSCINHKKTFVIVPIHLLEQTKETFGVITQMYSLSNLSIVTDYDVKLQLLQKGYDPDNIFIMDEIDMMIDPRTSNFQLVHDASHVRMSDDMINAILTILMKIGHINTNGVYIVGTVQGDAISFLEQELLSVLKMESVININYGMSKKYLQKRVAIPYIRKDTPLENSDFSSQIVTFVMTFLYFFAEGVRMDYNDFKLICTNKNSSIIKLLDSSLLKDMPQSIFIDNATQCFNAKSRDDKVNFVLEYLKKYAFSTISMPADKMTCSFVDIMGLDSLWWGIGYSGTVDVDFPELCDSCKGFDNEVIVDADEHISMDMIFNRTHENTQECNFGSIKTEHDIWSMIDTHVYDALIDLGGFFKDYENYEIVKKIAKIASYTGKIFVYLDNNDKKKIYDGGATYSYSGQEFESGEVFYFYSQKNTVGVDFRQPSKMKCLMTINKSATMSQVAQGAWRARKLIQGHTIDMVINAEITTGRELQDILKHNSTVYRDSQKGLLDYQTLKWTFRRYASGKNKYFEEKIPQKYLFYDRIRKSQIIQLMKYYIAHNDEKIWENVVSNRLYTRLISSANLHNIVLGTSSSQHTETTQEEEEEQQQHESTRVISAVGNRYIRTVYPGLTWFFLPSDNIAEEIKMFTQELYTFSPNNTTSKSARLLLSSHSFLHSSGLGTCNMVLVRLTQKDFLLVDLGNNKSYFYYDKFPMYNVHGNLINKHALHDMVPQQECTDDTGGGGGGCKEGDMMREEYAHKIILPEILTVFDNIIPDNIDILKNTISGAFYNYIYTTLYNNRIEKLYFMFPEKNTYKKHVDIWNTFATSTTDTCNTQTKTGATMLEDRYIEAAEYNKDKTPLGRNGIETLDDLLKMYEYPS